MTCSDCYKRRRVECVDASGRAVAPSFCPTHGAPPPLALPSATRCHNYCQLSDEACRLFDLPGVVDDIVACAAADSRCYSVTGLGGPLGAGATVKGCVPEGACDEIRQIAAGLDVTTDECKVFTPTEADHT